MIVTRKTLFAPSKAVVLAGLTWYADVSEMVKERSPTESESFLISIVIIVSFYDEIKGLEYLY